MGTLNIFKLSIAVLLFESGRFFICLMLPYSNKSEVLYLSLEDTLLRLQNRLYELTEEPHENLKLAVEAPTIGNGLEEQLMQWSQDNPNLKLIVT